MSRGYKYLRPISAYSIFHTLLKPKPGESFLDIACGPGLLLKCVNQLSPQVNLHGIDISDEAIRMAKVQIPSATLQQHNAEDLPYENNSFDFVTCIGSLERMLDRQAVLTQIHRVAKDNATICLMVRNAENITWKKLLKPFGLINQNGHQDALTLEDWSSLLGQNNFQITAIYPDHWPYYRLIKTLLPWKKIDTSRILQFRGKLSLAYEFIYLLKKNK